MKAEFTLHIRVYSAAWQQLLRQSISLYWALGNQITPELEQSLSQIESQMVWHLLQDTPATAESTAQAWAIISSAQNQFLADMQYDERPSMLAGHLEPAVEPQSQLNYCLWEPKRSRMLAA